ncbi:hypothetical protein KUV65_04070 [Maritalea mobilis]|uniref:hypothetical protein n=1 Tax=Maritalea mobilis TaxID=483324 RepID=UPI001C969778|nr:hypothetical protein [Maritalea mobilis]MBY6200526.1 hypothetical protein [Maritalea mobilis]
MSRPPDNVASPLDGSIANIHDLQPFGNFVSEIHRPLISPGCYARRRKVGAPFDQLLAPLACNRRSRMQVHLGHGLCLVPFGRFLLRAPLDESAQQGSGLNERVFACEAL